MLLISKSGNVDEKEMYGHKEFKIFYPLIENGVSQLNLLKNSVTELLFLIFYE